MSYILDALRKADAEREIGGVPSLHARPLGWPDEDRVDSEHTRTRASTGAPWGWIVLGAASTAVVMAAAWGIWRATPAPAPAPAVSPAPAPAVAPATVAPPMPVAAAPSPVPAVAPTGSANAVPPSSPTLPAPAPAPAPAPPPAAKAPPPRPAARAEVPRPPRPAAQPALPAAPAPAVGLPATAATPVRLPNFNELSPELKQGLPALVVSGSVYSADPASRLLIVNGQLLKEGDALGPGAVLEKIQPKSAVVRVRDQRAVLTW